MELYYLSSILLGKNKDYFWTSGLIGCSMNVTNMEEEAYQNKIMRTSSVETKAYIGLFIIQLPKSHLICFE